MLLIPESFGYARRLLRGVYEYARGHGGWVFDAPAADYRRPPAHAIDRADGVIALLDQDAMADLLAAHQTPVVNVGDTRRPADARVQTDDPAIGRAAAEHLLGLGLRHLACVDTDRRLYTAGRREAFESAVARRDRSPAAPFVYEPASVRRSAPALAAWLKRLPRPAGVFCTADALAVHVAEACHARGFRIPEDIALLGVNNDDVNCERMNPPLSSIHTDGERAGYLAAEALDALMDGRRPITPQRVPPVGVVTRRSTDTLAVPDLDTRAALRYIREHVGDGLLVDDVLAEVPVSRSSLERRFKQLLGRTPLQEIRRTRIERAKQLLSTTRLSMSAIAASAGFNSPQRMATVFKQETGITPRAYRGQFHG